MIFTRHAAFVLLSLAALAPPARAALVLELTPTASPVGGGFEYRYTLTNPVANADDGDPDLIYDFALAVPTDAALMDFLTPAGWTATYTTGDPEIDWMATDLPFAVAPGTSLTFGFTSLLGPADTTFSVLALNQLSEGGNIDLTTGTTVGPVVTGPVAVPEPSSLVLAGTGAAGLLAFGLRQVRRSKVAHARSGAATGK